LLDLFILLLLPWYFRDDKDDGSSRKSGTPPPPEVDDEGYRIRPKVDNWDNDKNFYSSSDTDSGNTYMFLNIIKCNNACLKMTKGIGRFMYRLNLK
jgi:hypothetical protein